MYAGIDLGGTAIKAVLIDKSGKELSFKEAPTPKTAPDIEEALVQMIEVLATSATISKIDIKGIGIGTAGSIDKAKGSILTSSNIKCLDKHPLAKNLETRTGIKVFLENDATVALIGEWWQGNGSKYRNWILLTLGTGVGGGAFVDNKVYSVESGNAMEVGHTTIDFNGRDCACGSRGCLERYASVTALLQAVEDSLESFPRSTLHERLRSERLSGRMVYEEALNKDELSLKCLEETATFLGFGVANLVNIFSPEAVIFGGGLSQAHKFILPVVKKTVAKRALNGLKENVQYLVTKDPKKIPALGAAKIALDRFKV